MQALYDEAAAFWQHLHRHIEAHLEETAAAKRSAPPGYDPTQRSGDDYSDRSTDNEGSDTGGVSATEEGDVIGGEDATDRRSLREQGAKAMWRYFWGAHQRFFRALCISTKVGHF